MNGKRIVLFSVAALLLAGCATNNDGNGGTGGGDGEDVDLTLRMGTMMPITGALSDLGGDMENGAKLAAKQINDANVGLRIEQFHEDDKTTDSAAAPNTFQRLVGQDVTVVAGPCCSGVTAAVLDKAVESKVVVASPSATSPSLTLERDNQGFFWRVSPSDAVQGKVLAKVVADDGVRTVNLIIVNNAYGNGLAKVFSDTFPTLLANSTGGGLPGQGGGVVTKTEKIDENAETVPSSVVTSACTGAGTPALDAIVIVAYINQGASILKEMEAQGCRAKVKIYGSEGIYKGNGPEGLPQKAGKNAQGQWLAAGVKGTNPESGDLSAFNAMFKNAYGHDAAQYSAESYDAVMYLALAALKARSVDGEDISKALPEIANAPGTKCSDFAACAQALLDGQDIDYQGAAHDFEFDTELYEPKTGVYSVWEVGEDGNVETTQTGKTA